MPINYQRVADGGAGQHTTTNFEIAKQMIFEEKCGQRKIQDIDICPFCQWQMNKPEHMPPNDHQRIFFSVLFISLKIGQGILHNPTDDEKRELYFVSFERKDHFPLVTAGYFV